MAVLGAPLSATIVPRFTLEELASKADMILQGRVTRSWSAWDATHKFIWTHHQLRVKHALKGPSRATAVESEPGGTVNGRSMTVQGTPQLRVGEEVILFLYRTPVGYLRTVGYGQGRYSIVDGRVHSDLSGVELAGKPAGTALETLEGLTTSNFRRRLGAAMETIK